MESSENSYMTAKRGTEVGELFMELRQELDITQCDFAEMLGVSQSMISKIERKLMAPRAEVLIRACRRLAGNQKARRKLYTFVFRAPKTAS